MTTEELNLYAALVGNTAMFIIIVAGAIFGVSMLVKFLLYAFRSF